jgi:hypothetical protein
MSWHDYGAPIAVSLSVRLYNGDLGSTVVKVLRYKSEGRGFDSRLSWNVSLK